MAPAAVSGRLAPRRRPCGSRPSTASLCASSACSCAASTASDRHTKDFIPLRSRRPRTSAVAQSLLLAGALLCVTSLSQAEAATFSAAFSSSCSRIADCVSEAAAATSLTERAWRGFQNAREASGEAGKEEIERVMEEDVKTAIERGWWKVAKEIILQSHKADADVTSTVRKSVADVRVHLDELIRVLNKQHHEIPVVPPAFQWAQSPIEVFLNIKFAYRWSSPGALSVTDPQFTSEARSFTFTGIGTHSGIQKKYSLSLGLFEDIVPEATKWSFASVGKVVVTLQKKKVGVWHRLTEDKAKISNMNVWWDMKEKVQKDLDDFHHGNYTVALSTDSTQTGEVNAEEQAEKATTDHDEEL